VRLYDVASRKEFTTIRLDAFGGCLVFSPHGDRLAIGHYSGSVTLWDVPTGTLVQRYAGHAKAVAGIAFSPDGKLLATAGRDGIVSLWPAAEDREPNDN
jgi:WD40 repeat protein